MSPNNFNLNRISKGASVRSKGTKAFTLIELLVVIAIIALLAGFVLATAGLATTKSRESRIKGEKERLVSAIEDYKAIMGNYPPDNSNTNLTYRERCAKNSLFYELSGCTFENNGGGTFITQNKADSVKASDLKSAFGVKGVENSARNKKDIPYKGVSFRPNQFDHIAGFDEVDILIVPVDKAPYTIDAKTPNKKLNPWYYDASSVDRHNPQTFDLWAEFIGRDNRTNIIGNW